MNSQPAPTADLHSPLPTRQFRAFLLFFHALFLLALAMSVNGHLHHGHFGVLLGRFYATEPKPMHGWADGALVAIVAVQAVLYCWFFVAPSLTGRWPARWWWYYAASVALLLAECRIEPGLEWVLIMYIGQISGLPMRQSVPVSAAVFAVFLLSQLGWSQLAALDAGDWLAILLTLTPWFVMILFFGRTIATSGERGQLILELEAAKRTLELARQREGELAALRERERLARELHDSLGHALVTLTVQLEAAQRLQTVDPPRVTTLLTELQSVTRASMEDLRRSLDNLRAPGLGDRPLAEALRTLFTEIARRSGITVDGQLAEGTASLPPAVAEVLWRVAQEGLTNVEKHAHARHVLVTLALPPREAVLRVADDGIGLPPGAEDKPGHYGLRGLRERVEGLGGTLATPAAGKGTILEARAPVLA
jgi:signal transduction histidine kinase